MDQIILPCMWHRGALLSTQVDACLMGSQTNAELTSKGAWDLGVQIGTDSPSFIVMGILHDAGTILAWMQLHP